MSEEKDADQANWMDSLPLYINVSKTITYDIEQIVENWLKDNGRIPTEEEVVELIEEWTKDDFSCGWGHQANPKELIWTDDNGKEW